MTELLVLCKRLTGDVSINILLAIIDANKDFKSVWQTRPKRELAPYGFGTDRNTKFLHRTFISHYLHPLDTYLQRQPITILFWPSCGQATPSSGMHSHMHSPSFHWPHIQTITVFNHSLSDNHMASSYSVYFPWTSLCGEWENTVRKNT